MKSKAKEYVKSLGKSVSDLPGKYQENFDAMQDFADILEIAEPSSEDYQEAKAEWEDYDEQILKALKRDYPGSAPAKKKPAPTAAKKPASDAKKPAPKQEIKGMPPVDENGERRIDDAALDALEAHIETLPQTKKMHTKDGEYTAERKKLHDKIITEEVEGNACIRREAPIAILTGGLPGSGKSTYIRNNKDWMTNPAIFKIDADDIRAKLPEYKGWNASQTHSETQDLTKTLLNKVGKFGCSFDVIYDGTMNKSKKYKPLIDTLKKEGYRVFIMFMKVDKETSMERAMGRYKRSGRYVPRFVIEEGAENGLAAFNELKNEVDGYVLVDGKTQKVLEKGGAEIPNDRDYDKLVSEPATKKQAQKKTTGSAAYSWKKAVPVAELQPVVLHCQHYHVTVKEPTEVSLKGTGNASRKVTAKPGEHIIFDDKGYPVFVMNASSFSRKCTEQSTVEKNKEDKHKPASKPKASTTKPASKAKSKPKTSKAAQPSSKTDDKKPAAAKSTSASKPAASKKASAPKKKTESKPASSRRSPMAVVEAEIRDIRNAQKKPMSADDREKYKKEYADLEKKKDNKSYLGYIRKQLKAAEEDGVKLSEAQVKKLGIMIQPLIQNPGGAFLDILSSNKKRLNPTYENLLRWTESPDRYDLIGVDTARKDSTVKARKPKKPSIFDIIGF
ncbi:zeta toxin family protein [Phaeodactylibacter xiamenensis]|uniref:zeta toxin family protein n=1 Tax=Phaeodactylibacter xiamenensis TaxID=1524460 RepID=UPI0024A90417|nr:zeta toxin family protein [Phaeodactylibacter xiamenensis]